MLYEIPGHGKSWLQSSWRTGVIVAEHMTSGTDSYAPFSFSLLHEVERVFTPARHEVEHWEETERSLETESIQGCI